MKNKKYNLLLLFLILLNACSSNVGGNQSGVNGEMIFGDKIYTYNKDFIYNNETYQIYDLYDYSQLFHYKEEIAYETTVDNWSVSIKLEMKYFYDSNIDINLLNAFSESIFQSWDLYDNKVEECNAQQYNHLQEVNLEKTFENIKKDTLKLVLVQTYLPFQIVKGRARMFVAIPIQNYLLRYYPNLNLIENYIDSTFIPLEDLKID